MFQTAVRGIHYPKLALEEMLTTFYRKGKKLNDFTQNKQTIEDKLLNLD